MHLSLLITAAILAGSISSTASENEYYDTGHSPVQEKFQDARLHNIGRLYYDGNTYCTATVIPPDVLVTAAHCLVDDDGKLRSIPYIFGSGAATPENGHYFEIDISKSMPLTMDVQGNRALDFAFMTLKHPVDLKYFPRVAFSSVQSLSGFDGPSKNEQNFFLTAYNPSKESIGTTESCIEHGYFPAEGTFYHDCSTVVGMSGAPIYIFRNGVLTIVGIHTSGRGDYHGSRTSYSDETSNIAVDGKTVEAAYQAYLTWRKR